MGNIRNQARELAITIDIVEEKKFESNSVKFFEKKFNKFMTDLIDHQIKHSTNTSKANVDLNVILMELSRIWITNEVKSDIYLDLLRTRYQNIKVLLDKMDTIEIL